MVVFVSQLTPSAGLVVSSWYHLALHLSADDYMQAAPAVLVHLAHTLRHQHFKWARVVAIMLRDLVSKQDFTAEARGIPSAALPATSPRSISPASPGTGLYQLVGRSTARAGH